MCKNSLIKGFNFEPVILLSLRKNIKKIIPNPEIKTDVQNAIKWVR
jgi:hypothetical protein